MTEAENGQVAIEAMTAGRPDVIILDLMMPKMDGFEFLDEWRGRSEWQDIPVVVITANLNAPASGLVGRRQHTCTVRNSD